MLEAIREPSCWDSLAKTKKPIVLYGMGNGADSILDVLQQRGIRAQAVFASDGFVRGHSFRGFQVRSYDEVCQEFGEFVILLSFAVHDSDMLGRIQQLSKLHELYAPDVPVAGDGLFTREYLAQHEAEFDRAYQLLADEPSRKVFREVLRFKVSGNPAHLFCCQTDKDEAWQLLNPSTQEDYADLGAYDGDTIRELLAHTGGCYRRILALEPDEKNFRKLSRNTAGFVNTDLLQVAAWDRPATLPLSKRGGRNSRVAPQGEPVRADALDNLANHPVSLLKLDVEGSEARALDGARKTIRRDRPKLYLCAYHRNEDLFALPLQLESICPGYRIYLRHHPYVPAWETNFYCLP